MSGCGIYRHGAAQSKILTGIDLEGCFFFPKYLKIGDQNS